MFPLLLRGSNVFRRFTEAAPAVYSIHDIFTQERTYWDTGFTANEAPYSELASMP